MLLVAWLCQLAIAESTAQSQHALREVDWGMSRSEVVAAEKPRQPTENRPDRLRYTNVKLDDKSYALNYEFRNNKLVVAEYYFRSNKATRQSAINAYLSFNEILTEKYGQPLSPYKIEDLTKQAPAHRVMLTVMSETPLFKIWDRPSHFITLTYLEAEDDNLEAAMVTYYYKLAEDLTRSNGLSKKDF